MQKLKQENLWLHIFLSAHLNFIFFSPGLLSASMMNNIVVMEIHQHRNGLPNDEREPDGRVAVVPVQVATHKPSQRNLRGGKVGIRGNQRET